MIEFLQTNIYFAIIFGSFVSAIVLIYSRNRVVFNVNKTSGIVKIIGMSFFITILSFVICIIFFDINLPKQAMLVAFSVVNFLSNQEGRNISELGEIDV